MKEKLPLVSVRIVCYNQKDFIRECIDSVLEQDYPNIEIVIADDCSTDGTTEILKEYKEKYPEKIILALSDANQGITKNINSGLKLCKGKYIAGLGGDDLMLHGKITKQVEYMEANPDCTICYHNLDVFDSDTNKTLYYFNDKYKYEGDVVTIIKYGTFNGACSNLIRKEKIPKKGFNELLPTAADWLCWCDTLANGGTIDYIDEVLGRYRRHENNVTNKKELKIAQNELDHLNSCNILLQKYPQYFSAIMYRYSNILVGLRHKLPYFKTLLMSLKFNINIKAMGALVVYMISFGRKRL